MAKLDEIFSVDAAGYTNKGKFERSGKRLSKAIKCRRANNKPSCPKAVRPDIVEEEGKKFAEIRGELSPTRSCWRTVQSPRSIVAFIQE